jgi:mannose-1-phosphate guanylyltransferase
MQNQLEGRCERAVIVLASSDGTHFHKHNHFSAWHSVPKQFCTFNGPKSLVELAVSRAARLVPSRSTAILVNRADCSYYERLTNLPSSSIFAQPSKRESVTAILYGLRCLSNLDRSTIVAVLPCNHFFQDDDWMISQVEEAMASVEASPALTLVLGTARSNAKSSFGWIEPGEQLDSFDCSIFRVRRYWPAGINQADARTIPVEQPSRSCARIALAGDDC